MRPYKLISIVALTFCCFSMPALSAAESHEKAANELLDAINFDLLLGQSIDVMMQIELANNPVLKPYQGIMKDFFNKYMSGESLRDDFVVIYTETFTETELDKITAFYKTPVGQKTLKHTPTLMAKGARIGQQRVQNNSGELKAMIENEAIRIKNMQKEKTN